MQFLNFYLLELHFSFFFLHRVPYFYFSFISSFLIVNKVFIIYVEEKKTKMKKKENENEYNFSIHVLARWSENLSNCTSNTDEWTHFYSRTFFKFSTRFVLTKLILGILRGATTNTRCKKIEKDNKNRALLTVYSNFRLIIIYCFLIKNFRH